MTKEQFVKDIRAGIPDTLPEPQAYDTTINHAPKRKDILTEEEKRLALRNALRYFPQKFHAVLAPEFAEELKTYGRIYMYRFRPTYEMYARPIDEYPHRSQQAAAIMMMIQNNLDKAVAQHPHELITYGGNGAVFQNWAQYRLVMKYLSEMTDEQTLVMYSGHPLGLFPSHKNAPRVVVTNGMVIPNYSKPDDWERDNALGVSQYGQMTAGSYMYIGPQGIVHGTTITVLNAARKVGGNNMKLFVTAGLGGMSGAQPKAGNIAGVVSVTAEINPLAARKRYEQGWVDELHENLDELIPAIRKAVEEKRVVSMAYVGNVVDLWERLADENIRVDLGSDQTSLHNPWAGGYYPVGQSLEESKRMMPKPPKSLKRRYKSRSAVRLQPSTGSPQKACTSSTTAMLSYSNQVAQEPTSWAKTESSVIHPTCKTSWGRCSSTMVSARSDGYARRATRKIWQQPTASQPKFSKKYARLQLPTSSGS